jgi:Xaa-Pro aminopeptidase
MLLLDSGGQYPGGTTDVTRTLHLGTPTPWQRQMFTRVLKGHIALASTLFPDGTPGMALDAFARSALWQASCQPPPCPCHPLGIELFPDGTPGMALDAFARSALWQASDCPSPPRNSCVMPSRPD